MFVLLALGTQIKIRTCGFLKFHTFNKLPLASNGLAKRRKVVGITNVWLYDKHIQIQTFSAEMTDKFKLTEDDLKQLLLVSKVRLNVLKNDDTEDHLDETSESTDTDRNQATVACSEHNKTRR